MTRYLVVANQTLGGAEMLREVRNAMVWGGAFHVVVPATPINLQLEAAEGNPVTLAHKRLERFIGILRHEGAEVTGSVGSPDPFQAVSEAMALSPADEIMLSTLPAGVSRWIESDLPDRLRRAFHIPVTHIVAEADLQPHPTKE